VLSSSPIRILLLCVALSLPIAAKAFAAVSRTSGWQAVLVAGDDAQPVFDNAIRAVRDWLTSSGVPARNIRLLSATPDAGSDTMTEPASAERVLARIAALRPGPDEGCLVFITSHGQRGEGIWLAYSGEFLRPAELARALSAGCARTPTVVIASGCFTGGFTAMRDSNRIIVTAARADRPSFGCAVERTYAVFDGCLLASLSREATWRAVVATTRSCVRERERELRATPSEPQATFGAKVNSLRLR
jgi:hypothetical protein